MYQLRAGGLGAVRMVAARTPSPSSPALVIRTSRSRGSSQDLLLANSRLSRRLLSLSPHATQLAVLAICWCRVRCRTFLEYEALAQTAGAARATELLSLSES